MVSLAPMFYLYLSKYKTCMVHSLTLLLFQSTVPLELPQVKPRRPDDSKGTGMQLKGPLSELRSAACPRPLGPSSSPQKPASSPESAADHLEEELDLLLNLDAPVKEEDNLLGKTSQDLKAEEDGEMAQEEKGTAWPPSSSLILVLVGEQPILPHTHLPWCLTLTQHCPQTSLSLLSSPLPPTPRPF